MSPILDLLSEMKPRPLAIYLGRVSILKLADYLRGYEHAVGNFGKGKDHFLADFRDWIHRRFQTTKQSWEEAILLHSADEADAVERFWQLLDEYLLETKGRALPRKDSESCPPANGFSNEVVKTQPYG